MKLLHQYLAWELVFGLLLAAAVILPLFGFLDLIEQLEDVGEGYYRTEDAFYYVANLQPRRLVQLSPFIALLGCVIALGRLAASQELIAMRASGFPITGIGRAVFAVAAGLLLLTAVLEEFVAPRLQQHALIRRSDALAQSSELGKDLGIWTRDATHVLRLAGAMRAGRVTGVDLFTLDEQGFLVEYRHAESAALLGQDHWQLRDVTRKVYADSQVEFERQESSNWVPFLNKDQMAILNKPPDSLSVSELYRHVGFLQETGQDARAYSLAFWRKFGGGFLTLAMVLLSIPFAAAYSRAGFGTRLLLAGLTGLGVYLLDQLVANAGLFLALSPPLVAVAPGITMLAASLFLIRRMA